MSDADKINTLKIERAFILEVSDVTRGTHERWRSNAAKSALSAR